MTVEEKLAHFMDAAIKENTVASNDMLQSYQASLDEQFEAHKEAIRKQANAEAEAELEVLRREGNKQLAQEHMVIRRMLSQKHSELTEQLFSEVLALLSAYKQSPEYPKLLLSQIRKAKKFAKDDALTIYLDPDDAGYQADLEEKTNTHLIISQYRFGGGIRAVIPSRRILIDNSFESKIAEQKNNFHFTGFFKN